MKVDIILITFNQEKYVRQAVESILMQRFNGELEVIIADDCSTDATLQIIKSFESTSSLKFRYLDSSVNLGIVKNYKRAFEACDGDYIAVLEGDDYWCNLYRLQRHVDFLDEHRECVMSWNPQVILNEDSKLFETSPYRAYGIKYVSFTDFVMFNWVSNYSSCVYRQSVFDRINPDLFNVDVEVPDEWLIALELTQHGLAALFNEVMTVYRKGIGVWGKLSEEQMTQKYFHRIKVYDKYFEYKYTKAFQAHKIRIEKGQNDLKEEKLKLTLPPVIIYSRSLIKLIYRLLKGFVLLFIPISLKRNIKARLIR